MREMKRHHQAPPENNLAGYRFLWIYPVGKAGDFPLPWERSYVGDNERGPEHEREVSVCGSVY